MVVLETHGECSAAGEMCANAIDNTSWDRFLSDYCGGNHNTARELGEAFALVAAPLGYGVDGDPDHYHPIIYADLSENATVVLRRIATDDLKDAGSLEEFANWYFDGEKRVAKSHEYLMVIGVEDVGEL